MLLHAERLRFRTRRWRGEAWMSVRRWIAKFQKALDLFAGSGRRLMLLSVSRAWARLYSQRPGVAGAPVISFPAR